MNNRGMTLLEVMMAVSILSVVMGTLFALALSMGDTAQVQEAKIVTSDQTRQGLESVARELFAAARNSIAWAGLPGETLTYRVATDLDGNGTAVDVSGKLEVSAQRTICRDTQDLNGDGITNTQLVLVSGDVVWVLANDLVPVSETTDVNGVFGPAQDLNGNGRLDRGFWVEASGNGLMITIGAQGADRRNHTMTASLSEFVIPRN